LRSFVELVLMKVSMEDNSSVKQWLCKERRRRKGGANVPRSQTPVVC